MEELVLKVIGLLMAELGFSVNEAEQWYQERGLHHQLLELVYPDIDSEDATGYAAALDDFEGNLQQTLIDCNRSGVAADDTRPSRKANDLSTVISAAEVRRDQWLAVAAGSELSEVVNELYEADQTEGQNMADLLTGAINNLA